MRPIRQRIAIFDDERDLPQIVVEAQWFALREAVTIDSQVNTVAAIENVQTSSYSIPRDYFCRAGNFAKFASIRNPAKDRIVGNDYCGRSQGTREAEIDLSAILPGPARLL